MTALRLATANIFKGMPPDKARLAIETVLIHRPDVLALQEVGRGRGRILRDLDGYSFARPVDGGAPIVYGPRFSLVRCRAVVLARREFVGHMPGRKSRLPATVATLAVLHDEATGHDAAVIDFHLTAEVQYAGRYRRDLAHRLRVRRHKRERRRLRALIVEQRSKGRDVYALGDGNYDGLTLPPLTSCWEGRRAEGTLGNRAVDAIYAETRPTAVRTVVTGSDHRAVVANYKE